MLLGLAFKARRLFVLGGNVLQSPFGHTDVKQALTIFIKGSRVRKLLLDLDSKV